MKTYTIRDYEFEEGLYKADFLRVVLNGGQDIKEGTDEYKELIKNGMNLHRAVGQHSDYLHKLRRGFYYIGPKNKAQRKTFDWEIIHEFYPDFVVSRIHALYL